jgi:hypothetical protein
MSTLKDILLETYNSSKLFYDNYISISKIGNVSKNFNKIRLYFINLIKCVKIFFYNILN